MGHIVVTGGTSGIGKGVADYFTSVGHNVSRVGLSSIGETHDNDVYYVDVADEDAVKKLFESFAKKHGGIDVLVNAAGIYIGNDEAGISNLDSADFEKVWRVNTFGAFLVSKYAMPLLKKARGNVVMISSISGLHPDAGDISYCVSKAGLSMLAQTLALAHSKDGVRVNAVCPGPIDTPMLRNGFGGQLENNPAYDTWIAQTPLGRAGKVRDVVKAVAYLADPENDFVTGSLLVVDGAGWTARRL